MTPDQETPVEEEKIAEAAAALYRREKIRFRWTCIFAALASLAWTSEFVVRWLARRELLHLGPYDDSRFEEFRAVLEKTRSRVMVSALMENITSLGLLICLGMWLVAIKRRRTGLRKLLPDPGRG